MPIPRKTRPDFTTGQRVQTHSATDSWMRGDRHGDVVRVLATGLVSVKLDSGRIIKFHPSNILAVAS